MQAGEGSVFEVDERGFRGELLIAGSAGERRVRVEGVRPDENDTVVAKDVPSGRDPDLDALVERCVSGEPGGAAAVLAHLGILDPA